MFKNTHLACCTMSDAKEHIASIPGDTRVLTPFRLHRWHILRPGVQNPEVMCHVDIQAIITALVIYSSVYN